MKVFSAEEVERYARHLVLPEVGGGGQQKLAQARVMIIGLGGLGAPVAQYLAAAGIGSLTLVDHDIVSLSNLQRQILFTSADIGRPKAEVTCERLRALNPHCLFFGHQDKLAASNAENLIKGHDLVIEGTDGVAVRHVIAAQAKALTIPLLSGGVSRYDGYVTLLTPWLKDDHGHYFPDFDDLFPLSATGDGQETCAETGVLGALTGVIGTLMAMEALKYLLDLGDSLAGKLLLYDGLGLRFRCFEAHSYVRQAAREAKQAD